MTYADLLRKLKIQYLDGGHHHCRAGWLQMDCPFCGRGSNKYHLGLNASYGNCNCWQCGKHPLPQTLSLLANVPQHQIYPLLKNIDRVKAISLPRTGKLQIPKGVGELLPAHKRYLRERGYDPDEVEELWGVKGIGISTRLAWRLWLPITLGFETVSWTTRAIGKADLRYISARREEEAIDHKSLLYGEELAGHAIVITEGPFDAWRIGPGAVCTFGLNYTGPQVQRMASYPVRAVCFDNAAKPQSIARKLADTLALFPGETYVVQLSGKDADTSPRKELEELRKRFQL